MTTLIGNEFRYDSSCPPPVYEAFDSESVVSEPVSPNPSKASSTRNSTSSSPGSSRNSINYTMYSDDTEAEDYENLPSYTPALTKTGLLQIKPELSSPYCRASRRNWRTAEIELNNTQIKLTQSDFCGFGVSKHTAKYSLQFAEVGLASDYTKRPHCFRLRVETKQFVFDCKNRQEMLGWMIALQMAISLALPLELRQMPEEIKRRRRRGSNRERRRRYEQQQQAASEQQRGNTNPDRIRSTSLNSSQNEHSICPAQHQRTSDRQSLSHYRSRNNNNNNNNNSNSQHTHLHTTQHMNHQPNPHTRPRPKRRTGELSNPVKWQPRRHQSRFSEKDFPHLFLDTTWEGKNVLYRGHWAFVRNRQLIIVLAGMFPR